MMSCKIYPSPTSFLDETLTQIEQLIWESNNFLGPIIQAANSELHGIIGEHDFFLAVWSDQDLLMASARVGAESNPVAVFSPLPDDIDFTKAMHVLVENTARYFDEKNWSKRYTDSVAVLGTPNLTICYAELWETITGVRILKQPDSIIASSRVSKEEYKANKSVISILSEEKDHIIREASIADMQQLSELTIAFHAGIIGGMSPDQCRAYIPRVFQNANLGLQERFLVYQVKSELTSLCLLRRSTSRTIAFAWVYTAEKWRGHGHAKRVLSKALDLAFNDLDKEFVCLNFEPSNNIARNLYSKLGFHMDFEHDSSIQQSCRLRFA